MYLEIFFAVSKTHCRGLSLHRCSSDVPLNSITLKISAEKVLHFSLKKNSPQTVDFMKEYYLERPDNITLMSSHGQHQN
jgi:hypothetical protein